MVPENLTEAETVLIEELERLEEILRARTLTREDLGALNTFLSNLIPAIDNLSEELGV